ncbi:MAG: HdeD family acid-resistance protein [Chloracidobacterium sp.]|nr:HdeD family acid-resistance protein [Chloracidobacterium sp.]MCO5334937.1 HdeD family acid-resistance protein [Pyrinomonadaceae bacterium]
MLLAKNWWAFLLRGIIALIFGAVAIMAPSVAFISLVLVFGIFALVDGIFSIASAFASNAKSENWWWLMLEGLVGILIGFLTIFQTSVMGDAWLFLIAAWAIINGVFKVVAAVRLRKVIKGEVWMILSGLLSVAFGVLVAMNPASGAFAVGFIIGIYAFLFGIMLILLSMKLKRFSAR